MSIRTTIALCAIFAACLAMPARAQEADGSTVVATIGGTPITIGHMIVLRDALPEQYRALPDDVLFKGILDQLIQQSLLAQSLAETSQAVELRLQNEERSLLAGEALRIATENAVTEEALQQAYAEKFANAEPTREFNASHILVATEEEAAAIVAEVRGGADFAETAQAKSTGPSGPNGGALGWFGPGMMVKPFEDAVLAMQPGEVSDPVQTEFGWHVIRLNEVRNAAAPEFDVVRDDLAQELQQKVIEDRLAELEAQAEVVRIDTSAIDPAILKDVSLVTE